MTKRRSGVPSDVELLQRVKAHDDVAWTELVRLYGPLVDWWLGRAGLGRDDRDDVFQDVFTTVARQIREFRCDHPGDMFRGWLNAEHFQGGPPNRNPGGVCAPGSSNDGS